MSYKCQIKCAIQLYKDIHYKGTQLVFYRVGTWNEALITEVTPRNTRAPLTTYIESMPFLLSL